MRACKHGEYTVDELSHLSFLSLKAVLGISHPSFYVRWHSSQLFKLGLSFGPVYLRRFDLIAGCEGPGMKEGSSDPIMSIVPVSSIIVSPSLSDVLIFFRSASKIASISAYCTKSRLAYDLEYGRIRHISARGWFHVAKRCKSPCAQILSVIPSHLDCSAH